MNKQLHHAFLQVFTYKGLNISHFARRHRLTKGHVSRIVRGERNISFRLLNRIAASHGFKIVLRLKRK
jgi:transcriptional regulator with XRE-family HTH domain